VKPRKYWTEVELRAWDGPRDEDGPILLLTTDGVVFNVYTVGDFCGPVGRNRVFSCGDATRLLVRMVAMEKETEDARKRRAVPSSSARSASGNSSAGTKS